MDSERDRDTETKPLVTSTTSSLESPPFRHPDFQKARTLAIEDAKDILEIYRASPQPPRAELINEAIELANYPSPDKRYVGLVGISGSGKSSLVCSLLGEDGIAIVEGAGKAVTCFPVYYEARLAEHKARYTIQCNFPAASAIEERLNVYLRELNVFVTIDPEEPIDWDVRQMDEDNRAAAEETFIALFGRMDGFSINKLKVDQGDVTIASATKALCEWRLQLVWPKGLKDGIWKDEASTEEALQGSLAMFRDNGLWPLIEKLTLYLDAPLLANGVVLVDLPGFHDTNVVRVKVARQTQSKCDDLFVVADITRAVDNPILRKTVEDNIARPELGLLKMQTVTAVCTHSGSDAESTSVERSVRPWTNASELRQAKANLRELKRKDAEWSAVTEGQIRVRNMVIEARNAKVIQDMQELYGSVLTPDNFHVFCVDNVLFMEEEDQQDISGIPQLQTHIAHLPAKTLFHINNDFIENRYHAMLYSYELWVTSCKPREDALKTVLPRPEALLNFHKNDKVWINDMVDSFNEVVVAPIRKVHSKISKDCLDVATAWRPEHPSTVRAIITKGGNHRSSKRRDYDWNKEMLACFRRVTDRKWTGFDKTLATGLTQLHRRSSNAYSEFSEICKQLGAPPLLLKTLRKRQQALDEAAGSSRDALVLDFGNLKRDVTGSHAGSYIDNAMAPAYQVGHSFSGKGSNSKRHDAIAEHVQNPVYVTDVCDTMSNEFRQLMETKGTSFFKTVESTARVIESDIDHFQGARDELPPFLVNPELGHRAERLLTKLQSRRAEIVKLAGPAQQRALELYGQRPPIIGDELGSAKRPRPIEESDVEMKDEASTSPTKLPKTEHPGEALASSTIPNHQDGKEDACPS